MKRRTIKKMFVVLATVVAIGSSTACQNFQGIEGADELYELISEGLDNTNASSVQSDTETIQVTEGNESISNDSSVEEMPSDRQESNEYEDTTTSKKNDIYEETTSSRENNVYQEVMTSREDNAYEELSNSSGSNTYEETTFENDEYEYETTSREDNDYKEETTSRDDIYEHQTPSFEYNGQEKVTASNSVIITEETTEQENTDVKRTVALDVTKLTLDEGATYTFKATVTPKLTGINGPQWSTSNSNVVELLSSGKVRAIAEGTAVITVRIGDASASCIVTVKQKITTIDVTGISLNKSSISLNKGSSTTLSATVKPSNASDKSIIWTSSNTKVATVNSGTVKAVGGGTTVITAKTTDGNFVAKCTVTVKVPVSSVMIKGEQRIALDCNDASNKTYNLSVSIYPSDASDKSVSYSVSDSTIAKVDSNGKITGLTPGITLVTVTSKSTGYKDTIEVHVYKSNAVIPKGGTIWYKIRPYKDQSYIMKVASETTYDGVAVKLSSDDNTVSSGLFQFHDYISKYSGIAVVPRSNVGAHILDANRGTSYSEPLKEGCKIDLWTLGSDNEASMWELVRTPDYNYIIRLASTDLVVAVSSYKNGAQLQLKRFNVFDLTQRWVFESVDMKGASTDKVTSKIASLRAVYVHGQYWNKKNGLSHTGTKSCSCSNVTCTYNCPCTCGAFIFNGAEIAWQCHGFALQMAYEVFGENANTWSTHKNVNSIYAGDVIRINNDTHTIFVTKVDGDKIYYVDCNWIGKCQVRWDGCFTRSQLSSKVTYIAHKSGNTSYGK